MNTIPRSHTREQRPLPLVLFAILFALLAITSSIGGGWLW
jgi:hypothetical protein